MSPAASISALRDRIRQIERPARHGVLPFGVAAIDGALPGGGLALGAVHEIIGQGGDEEDGAAAAGFAAAILARLSPHPPAAIASGPPSPAVQEREGNGARGSPKPLSRNAGEGAQGRSLRAGEGIVLWCRRRPDLYGPGLMMHGLDPARLVLVTAPRDDEILWALEEGLRTGSASGLAAVVGEIGHLPMVAGRRLQLAAERSGVTALILRRWRNADEAMAERDRPSAALTRWRVAALPSADIAGEPGIGRPRWRVELRRCRGAAPGIWDVEVADASGHVSLSAELADRPVAPARLGAEPFAPDSSEKRRAG
jgi:protein ImuA